jgi:uncharacterized protein
VSVRVRHVVAAATGSAVRVSAGERLDIVDVDGGQVGDLFAFSADDPAEYLSAGHTRAANWRLFPLVGEHFVTNRRRPMLELVEDTSPGAHDMLVPACDPVRYAQLGHDGHPNCHDNLLRAAAVEGISPAIVPQPVNVFMATPVEPDGTISYLPAPSRAGDRIAFRALLDVVLVLSACPMDLTDLNNGRLTDLAVEITGR